MTLSRRSLLGAIGGLSIAGVADPRERQASEKQGASRLRGGLPDKANFDVEGTYLNAAYTHPIGKPARASVDDYFHSRMTDGGRNWPAENARDAAVAAYAKLINASASEIAVVPSTLEGENLIGAALGLGSRAGVVTDPFHYDASLVLYGELHRREMPLNVVVPRGNRIDESDLEAAISADTRLVALSLVSSDTGYMRDLKSICDIAHERGVLVYADVIQAAGAVPLDVKASGVDFCCGGTYKYLMGEFGLAFLYVRSDRLPLLERVQIGWRQIKSFTRHSLPFDPPGPVGGEWELGTDTSSRFEVSTPNWSGLATVLGSINYIQSIGVENIVRHRAPLLERLREELPRHGFEDLAPVGSHGPYVVVSYKGARARFYNELRNASVFVTLAKDKLRIAPSVYNDQRDLDRLLRILCA